MAVFCVLYYFKLSIFGSDETRQDVTLGSQKSWWQVFSPFFLCQVIDKIIYQIILNVIDILTDNEHNHYF